MNNLHVHENRQCNTQSLVPSPLLPNFNVKKTVHVESQEVSTTLHQRRRRKY